MSSIIKLPQPDGSLLVKAGKPQPCADELTVSMFSQATGVSIRHIAQLCQDGTIKHRRMSAKNGSKILIPYSELETFIQKRQ